MKKLIYYGGKFDPPTITHRNVIIKICESISFSELWIVPKWHTPYASAFHRFIMAMRLHQDVVSWMNEDPLVRMRKTFPSMHEFDNFEYTWDAVEALKDKWDVHIAIGVDQANQIDTWKNWRRLTSEYPFVIVNRRGYEADENAWYAKAPHTFIRNYPNDSQISSTLIRKLMKEGKDLEWMNYISYRVLDYIEREKPYKEIL